MGSVRQDAILSRFGTRASTLDEERQQQQI
jgi:hypothetical protein